jgi:CheY-like chemotaxis protein
MPTLQEPIAVFTQSKNLFNSIKRYLQFVHNVNPEQIIEIDLNQVNDQLGESNKILFDIDSLVDNNERFSSEALLKLFSYKELDELKILFFSSSDRPCLSRKESSDKHSSLNLFIDKFNQEYQGNYGEIFSEECIVPSLQLTTKIPDLLHDRIKPVTNNFKDVFEILNDLELESSEKEDILQRVGKTDYDLNHNLDRDKMRKGSFHSAGSNEKQLLMQMVSDLIVEKINFDQKINKGKGELDILWLENNPQGSVFETNTRFDKLKQCKNALNWTFRYFPGTNIYLRNNAFDELYREIDRNKAGTIKYSEKLPLKTEDPEQTDSSENEVNSDVIDFILLDIFLDENRDGEDFIELFMKKYPEKPIVILSSSEDYELIEKCLSKGADFYVNKRFIFNLPLFFHKVYKKYGELIWLKLDEPYKHKLLGNVRYWMHHKDYLWYGDKCYHMIDHSFKHTYDNWKHTNQIMPLSLSILESKKEEQENNTLYDIKQSDIYCFSLATWLHDIGHKGNKNYSEAYQIRDNHGFISGEIVVKHPDLFNIIEGEGRMYDEHYKKIEFPHGPSNVPITQFILERKKYNGRAALSNLEKTALYCIYHKSNGPLTREKGEEMVSSGKFIPKEFFTNSDNSGGKLITLEDILDERLDENESEKQKFLGLITFFRFIDGLDIHDVRVGDPTEKNFKSNVIEQDKNYYLKKLKEEVDLINDRVAGDNPALALQVYNQLYQSPVEKIGKGEFKMDPEFRSFIEKQLGRLDNYWMILNYAQFISVQDGHFDLHSCVKDINIQTRYDEDAKMDMINITYTINSNFDLKWLAETKLREMRKNPASILEKLFGDKGKLPYTLNELEEGASYLNPFLNLEKGIFVTLQVPGNKSLAQPDETIKKAQLDKAKQTNETFIRKIFLKEGQLVSKDFKEL